MKRIVLAVLVPLLGLVAPASARSDVHELVLSGRGNTWTELRVTKPITIRCCDYRANDEEARLELVGMNAEVDRTYAGFVIERVSDRRVMVGAVRVPALDLADGGVPFFAEFGKHRRLAPGRYRVHLIGDGRPRVAVDLTVSSATA